MKILKDIFMNFARERVTASFFSWLSCLVKSNSSGSHLCKTVLLGNVVYLSRIENQGVNTET